MACILLSSLRTRHVDVARRHGTLLICVCYDHPHVGPVLSCSQFSLSKHGVALIGGTAFVAGPHIGWLIALRAVCQHQAPVFVCLVVSCPVAFFPWSDPFCLARGTTSA
jgi:hypothetical protein